METCWHALPLLGTLTLNFSSLPWIVYTLFSISSFLKAVFLTSIAGVTVCVCERVPCLRLEWFVCNWNVPMGVCVCVCVWICERSCTLEYGELSLDRVGGRCFQTDPRTTSSPEDEAEPACIWSSLQLTPHNTRRGEGLY